MVMYSDKNTREHLDVKCTLLSSDQKDNPWGFFSFFFNIFFGPLFKL